ncbi:MAG: integral rane sensor signal transduction histidine kinase [Thermoleophilia bacterium]|nr:integral rane sensor signal transduction histidine kinase [Thermoleophilia bacterium]
MNFRTRLTLLTCVAIALTLVAASFVTYSLARSEAYSQIDDALERRVKLTRAFEEVRAKRPSDDASRDQVPRVPGTSPGAAGGFSRVLGNDGTEQTPTPPSPPANQANRSNPARVRSQDLPEELRDEFRQGDVQLPITAGAKRIAAGRGQSLLRETLTVGGRRYRFVSGRVNDRYTVQVARPIAETEDFLHRLVLLLGAVTGGGVLIGVVAAFVVTRTASQPVHRLTELTAAVRESGDLSKRVEVTGNDDLGRLARNVNAMLEELERAAVRQQRLVDDASHQLRTPLASIRTNMDVLMRTTSLDGDIAREVMADLSAQTDELTSLVRDLVDLASSVESDVERGPVRLEEVAMEALRRVRGAFERLEFETDVEHATAFGSEERLVRMVQNLLHNAGKWSPEGGTVCVRVRPGEVQVIDHGPGVDDDEKGRIFERFYRAGSVRDVPGSGLGLAIVQQVAVDHGGTATVRDTPGGGATFVVRLPTQPGE